MIPIGERINGMFTDVKRAILEKDSSVIHVLARRQTEAGAKFLDCNVGTAAADREGTMRWLVTEIQNAVTTPIAVDSQNFDVVKAGVEACDSPIMINSVSGDPEKLKTYVGYALEKDASLIALTMDRRGIPQDVNTRVEIAATIVTTALEMGLAMDKLFIDPIIIPVNVAQDQPAKLLEVIQQVRMLADPPPHITLGLSNVSQKTAERSLINRTLLVMAAGVGLDSAIVDVLDTDLMDAWVTAEMLLNKQIYSDSFLKAARMM
jgi:5-methyltetrahydrofolate corrinoid/iron sulfur protein methyltransferase